MQDIRNIQTLVYIIYIMTKSKLKETIDHLWRYRDYLKPHNQFDYPFYGGLKGKMGRQSPESVDAMQSIWSHFINGEFKTKKEFMSRYRSRLISLGEKVR